MAGADLIGGWDCHQWIFIGQQKTCRSGGMEGQGAASSPSTPLMIENLKSRFTSQVEFQRQSDRRSRVTSDVKRARLSNDSPC